MARWTPIASREDAVAQVLAKWNTLPPAPHVHGDCVQVCVDYAAARFGWHDRFEYQPHEELNLKNVKRLFGKPHPEGELGLFRNGALFVVLPYGGIMGSFSDPGYFGRLPYNAEECDCVRFMGAGQWAQS